MSVFAHQSVLLQEAVTALVTDKGGVYIDGTFGRGGHSRAVLTLLSAAGKVIAFDKDPEAIAEGQRLQVEDERFRIVHRPFSMMDQVVEESGLVGKVSGILLDLGISSPQVDEAARGFSFMQDGPLDMRMDNSCGVTAATWIAQASAAEMEQVFRDYGEERFGRRIAGAIVKARIADPFMTTGQLAKVVSEANPKWEKHKHPATRVFQAIRIHINEELTELSRTLAMALRLLHPGGRLVIISFHSLEDRLVKRFFRDEANGDDLPSRVPIMDAGIHRRVRIVSKPVKPGAEEIELNPRARSAVMRVAEKL